MCGIAGYVGSKLVDESRVRSTLAQMRRRGPDQQTATRHVTPKGRHVALLHARLSIVDLDPRSNQPFERAPWTVAYNGEAYNYIEVRSELEARGVTFRTSSDTEVLVETLRTWGLGGLDRLEGMWAFAAYDADSGALHLVRDRFGEKPLYVLETPDGLYFASEVKFLATLSGLTLKPNRRHLARYLVNGYKSLYKSRDTFFENVREVPWASALTVLDGGTVDERRYWEPHFQPDDGLSFETAVQRARDLFIDSVRLRLRADVPLAFCMSGGIDSNSIISVAKRVCGYDVHGFTILNSDARYEENDLVELAVKELGVRHSTVQAKEARGLSELRTLVRQHDAPVFTISYFLHWLLMGSIHEAGYRVSVSGTGADEVFSGYYDHHLQYLYEVQGTLAVHDAYRAAWEQHVKPVVRNPYLSTPRLFIEDPKFRGHIFLDAAEFAAQLKVPFDEPFTEVPFAPGSLMRTRMLNELFNESVPVILHEDDLNAMYHSIENRSPFLDRRLLEFMMTVPTRHLMHDGKAKVLLREAMRGIVPQAVLDSRRKVGFNAPLFDVLDLKSKAVKDELLSDGTIFELVDRAAVATLLEEAHLPNSRSKFLFYFVCARLFLEQALEPATNFNSSAA